METLSCSLASCKAIFTQKRKNNYFCSPECRKIYNAGVAKIKRDSSKNLGRVSTVDTTYSNIYVDPAYLTRGPINTRLSVQYAEGAE